MIEKQREKEFLFELEQVYRKYNLVIRTCGYHTVIMDAVGFGVDQTTERIKDSINILRMAT